LSIYGILNYFKNSGLAKRNEGFFSVIAGRGKGFGKRRRDKEQK
jgi:hypothetical protein